MQAECSRPAASGLYASLTPPSVCCLLRGSVIRRFQPYAPSPRRKPERLFLLLLVAERGVFGEVLDFLLDHLALAIEEGGDRAAERWVGDPVRAVNRRRQIAALQFVGPLGAGLDPRQAALNRELDRLVIAAFEMQKAVFAVRSPIAAVDRVAAENVEGAGDVVGAAPRHDQHDLVRHALADQREEAARQIGRAPFPIGCAEIEAEERIPGPLGQVAAGQQLDFDAAGQRLAPLLLDRLALARIERGQIVVEIAVALVCPMELLADPLQEAGFGKGREILVAREIDMQRGELVSAR